MLGLGEVLCLGLEAVIKSAANAAALITASISLHVPAMPTFIYTGQKKDFPFLELSRPRARPPGAGSLEVEAFGRA